MVSLASLVLQVSPTVSTYLDYEAQEEIIFKLSLFFCFHIGELNIADKIFLHSLSIFLFFCAISSKSVRFSFFLFPNNRRHCHYFQISSRLRSWFAIHFTLFLFSDLFYVSSPLISDVYACFPFASAFC